MDDTTDDHATTTAVPANDEATSPKPTNKAKDRTALRLERKRAQRQKRKGRKRAAPAPVAAAAPPQKKLSKQDKRERQAKQEAQELDAWVEKVFVTENAKGGTLSDLLNPGHQAYNAQLKAEWKALPKRKRQRLIDADRKKLDQQKEAIASIKYPFPVEEDDHCESPVEAYQDIKPVLECIVEALGKSKEDVQLYDPYFCAGTCVRHLGSIGFPNVYNRCEDFYKMIKKDQLPEHDVLVSNPPYSLDHVEKIVDYCNEQQKPFLLLMPNYVAEKYYFKDGTKYDEMMYVCPRKRYNYWTPKGLRAKDKSQNHVSQFGVRTSPFLSFWYLHLGGALSKQELVDRVKDKLGDAYNDKVVLSSSYEEVPFSLKK